MKRKIQDPEFIVLSPDNVVVYENIKVLPIGCLKYDWKDTDSEPYDATFFIESDSGSIIKFNQNVAEDSFILLDDFINEDSDKLIDEYGQSKFNYILETYDKLLNNKLPI